MTPRRRLVAAMVTVSGAVTVLIGHSPAVAMAVTTAVGAEPSAFTLRYHASGWADLRQAGAAVLACPAEASACQDGSDPSIATAWVDTDHDDSTHNASTASLVIPPAATVDWVGLYWAGDRGTRQDGVAPRCEAAPEGAPVAVLPPVSDQANRVKVGVNGSEYVDVTAGSVAEVTGPGGGAGFQAYAEITALLRPPTSSASPTPVALTVASIQVAQGPGCSGGWAAVMAYSYPDEPSKTHAPTYRGLAVFDGVAAVPAGVAQEIRLDGLPASSTEDAGARMAVSLLASGQGVASDGLTLGGVVVARSGDAVADVSGVPGLGYHLGRSPLPRGGIKAGATSASVGLTAVRDGFVAAVFGLSRALPVHVDLSVSSAAEPSVVPVGGEAVVTFMVRNGAAQPATGVVVTAALSAGLTLVGAPPGYASDTGVWTVGRVAAGGTAALALRVRVTQSGPLTASAEVSSSDIDDVDSTPGDGVATQDDLGVVTLTGTAPSPSPSPSAAAADPSESQAPAVAAPMIRILPAALLGIGLFALGLLIFSLVVLRNRRLA